MHSQIVIKMKVIRPKVFEISRSPTYKESFREICFQSFKLWPQPLTERSSQFYILVDSTANKLRFWENIFKVYCYMKYFQNKRSFMFDDYSTPLRIYFSTPTFTSWGRGKWAFLMPISSKNYRQVNN